MELVAQKLIHLIKSYPGSQDFKFKMAPLTEVIFPLEDICWVIRTKV